MPPFGIASLAFTARFNSADFQLVKICTAILQRWIENQFYPNLFAHSLFRQGKQVPDHFVQI